MRQHRGGAIIFSSELQAPLQADSSRLMGLRLIQEEFSTPSCCFLTRVSHGSHKERAPQNSALKEGCDCDRRGRTVPALGTGERLRLKDEQTVTESAGGLWLQAASGGVGRCQADRIPSGDGRIGCGRPSPAWWWVRLRSVQNEQPAYQSQGGYDAQHEGKCVMDHGMPPVC